MDVRGLERELRKLPGVVSCAITGEAVSVLLSEDADAAIVAKEAASLAASFGAGAAAIRMLGSPDAAAVRPLTRSFRPKVAAATAFAAAVALIATLVPIGKKIAPNVAPPAAFRPAPAPADGGVLPPVVVLQPKTETRAPAGSVGAAGAPAGAVSGPPVVVAPRPSAPGPAVAPEPAQPPHEPDYCHPKGNAWGRTNHEGEGNQSRHRHHTHAERHDADHWFDCT